MKYIGVKEWHVFSNLIPPQVINTKTLFKVLSTRSLICHTWKHTLKIYLSALKIHVCVQLYSFSLKCRVLSRKYLRCNDAPGLEIMSFQHSEWLKQVFICFLCTRVMVSDSEITKSVASFIKIVLKQRIKLIKLFGLRDKWDVFKKERVFKVRIAW